MPQDSPEAASAGYAPLAGYLAERTGRPWQVATPPSTTALVDALAGGRVHLARLGALTYLQASDKAAARPVVRVLVGGRDSSHAVIVVPSDSRVHSIAELAGTTFAFGDIGSAAGPVVAHYALLVSGVDPRRHLQELPLYAGSDIATLLAVAGGRASAGAVDEAVLKRQVAQGRPDLSRLRVIWRSDAITTDPWVLSRRVDPLLATTIQEALLALQAPGLLPPEASEGFAPATGADYAALRLMATELGFLSRPEPTPAR